MKLNYFPEVYPGELLCSILARYHRHASGSNLRSTAEKLFAGHHPICNFDLPGRIGNMVASLPPERGFSAERLIMDHSLYPYYAAYRTEAERHRLLEAMVLPDAKPKAIAGLLTSGIPKLERLRFCPECKAGMLEEHGEMYWHREHHLPGVVHCFSHGLPLLGSTVSLSYSHRDFLVAADGNCCPDDARPVAAALSPSVAAKAVRIADLGLHLLRVMAEPADPVSRRDRLLTRARLAGLFRPEGRLDRQAFISRLYAEYGDVLEYLGVRHVEPECTGSIWPLRVMRGQRCALHPIYNLIVDEFLADLQTVRSPRPSGAETLREAIRSATAETVAAEMPIGWTVRKPGLAADRVVPELDGPGPGRPEKARPLPRPPAGLKHGGSTSAKPAGRRTRGRSIDWAAMDAAVVPLFRRAAEEIMAEDPPVKVTFPELLRRLGTPAWARSLALMPEASAELTLLVEPTEGYRRRRARWAFGALVAAGFAPTLKAVARKAGLNKYRQLVRSEVSKLADRS